MTADATYRTPGQLIAGLLEERGWSQRVLAIILKADQATINNLITGRKLIDAEMAIALGEVFGVPAEMFLELQTSYKLAQARLVAQPDPNRATRAHLFGGLPIAEMIKRGWIRAKDIRDVKTVEVELARFFKAASPAEIEVLPHAAKKTQVAGPVTPVQLAWLYRVRELASEIVAPRYSPQSVRDALPKLQALLAAAEEARRVPRILNECGIRFVICESLTSAKIDGVCTWLDETKPVIGMSLRHDRIDNFWFVLRHELEHVLRLHGQTETMLDYELEGERAGVGSNLSEEERVANEAAAEFCVPQRALKAFIARKDPFFAERDIIGFARTEKIHPGLVAGQLQHKTGRYERFRAHQVKVRSIVAPSAWVDGWGDIAPVGE